MSLMLARRSRVVFRHLNVTESSFASGRVSLPLRDAHRATLSGSPVAATKSGPFGTLLPSISSNSYATAAGKPKAHTGKAKASSKPKKSASAKATGEKPVKKKTTTKKPATKAKAKTVGRPKKAISKEEKEALKEKNELKALKEAMLKPPKQLPATAYTVLLSELVRDKGYSNVTEISKHTAEAYKNLTSQQRQEHEQTAESNKALNQAAYDAWVQSHTPLQIKEANQARTKLRRLAKESNGTVKSPPKIVDPRQVKKPSNAMMFFNSEQRATGDFKGMSLTEGSKELFKQFSQLSEHEKQKYNDLAAKDKARYFQQHKEVYGIESPSTLKKEHAGA